MEMLLEVAVLGSVIVYFFQRRSYLKRRNLQSWEILVSQLHFHATIPVAGDFSQLIEWLTNGTEPIWESSRSFRSLWKNFRTARILMEMADYAERNTAAGANAVNTAVLRSLRYDAMHVRVSSLGAAVRS